MIAIRINDEYLDLDKNVKIVLSKEFLNVAELVTGGGYSNNIRIPRTYKNERIFKYITESSASVSDFVSQTVEAIIEGETATIKVNLSVTKIDRENIHVYVFAGNTIWLDRVGDATLADLDYGFAPAVLNGSYGMPSFDGNFLFFVPYQNYYGQDVLDFSLDDLVPAIRLRSLLNAIASQYRFKIGGDFFDTNDYNRIFIPAAKLDYLETRENIQLAAQTHNTLGLDNLSITSATVGTMQRINFFDSSSFGMYDPDGVIANLLSPRRTQFTCPQDGQYTLKLGIALETFVGATPTDQYTFLHFITFHFGFKLVSQTAFADVNPHYYRTVQMSPRLGEYAGTGGASDFALDWQPDVVTRIASKNDISDSLGSYSSSTVHWLYFEVDVWLKKGEQIDAFLYTEACSTRTTGALLDYSQDFTKFIPAENLEDDYPNYIPRFEVVEKQVNQAIEGVVINWANILPKVSIKALFEELVNRFCLVVSYDETSGTVLLNQFKNIRNFNGVLDLSSKRVYNKSEAIDYKLSGYGKVNKLLANPDGGFTNEFEDKYEFEIDRYDLEDNKTIFETTFTGYPQIGTTSQLDYSFKNLNTFANRVSFDNLPSTDANYLVKRIASFHQNIERTPTFLYWFGTVSAWNARIWLRGSLGWINPSKVTVGMPIVWYQKTDTQIIPAADSVIIGIGYNSTTFGIGLGDRYWHDFKNMLQNYAKVEFEFRLTLQDYLDIKGNKPIKIDETDTLYLPVLIKEFDITENKTTIIELVKLS